MFSDTQTHGRSADNYRVSGVVDPMRVPKDAFFAHQVMWDGWVDDLKPRTYIVGHWNYKPGEVIPTVYVVSNADSVVLEQGGQRIAPTEHKYRFLYVFNDLKYAADRLTAIGMDRQGRQVSSYSLETSGPADHIKLTAIENPTGWKADGADVALVQVEVVDKQGRRCPLDNSLIKFELDGPAEWRGGVAKGKDNHVLCDTLPVECGVNRVMLRSLAKAGTVKLTAKAEGMAPATITLRTSAVEVADGLSRWLPSDGLKPVLDRGETPDEPSFSQWRRGVQIVSAKAGSGNDVRLSFDTFENTSWESSNRLDSAWVTYTLAENTQIDDICVKMKGFRSTTYPIAVYAGDSLVWEGWTPKALSYIHIPLKNAPKTNTITIRSRGASTTKDAFGAVQELDALCSTCIVCNAIEDNMNRYLHTFFHLYQNDSEFRKHFAHSKGVCLPHAVQLLKLAPQELPSRELSAFADLICNLETEAFDRIQGDVSWFIKKFDYRFQAEPWKDSRDAVERSVNKLRGWCVGKEPNPEEK